MQIGLSAGCHQVGSDQRLSHSFGLRVAARIRARSLAVNTDGGMKGVQPVQPGAQKPLLPAADGRRGSTEPLLDEAVLGAFGQHQDQLGTKYVTGR